KQLPLFIEKFNEVFQSRTHHFQDRALRYIEGLFKCPKGRANCYYMGEHLDGNAGQGLHHLLTQSPWSHSQLFKLIQGEANAIFKKHGQGCYLLIDEVGFRKKGSLSACVGRQYLGCIGTHDNGQVAVASALSVGQFYCPIDIRLFMRSEERRLGKECSSRWLTEH